MTFFTILSGMIAGLSPAIFTIIAFGSMSDTLIIICFLICLAVSTALIQSYDIQINRIKRRTAIIAFSVFQLLLLINQHIYANAFRLMNPAYYYEYGGPNAGSRLGLFVVDIPAAVVILIASCGLSLLISRKRSK